VETAELKVWAEDHADGPVVDRADRSLSLTSKLMRFRWNGSPTVGVGADADGKVRINAVLDGVAWMLADPDQGADRLQIVLGLPGPSERHENDKYVEHLDAVKTLSQELRDGPEVSLWTLQPGEREPRCLEARPARFTSSRPAAWAQLLETAADARIDGLASAVVETVDEPAFALYPKLSSLTDAEPWQMRLDGLDVGRIGVSSATLRLATGDLSKSGEPRDTWRGVVDTEPQAFAKTQSPALVAAIRELAAAWRHGTDEGAMLGHGRREHALEAHVLSSRSELTASCGRLRPAAVEGSGVLRAAQFPTLWGNVTRPRYLDALLEDEEGRPWAIEFKDQRSGGHGAYLRHGIGQAVLYRYYIRYAEPLNPWFERYGLDRRRCRAALAIPTTVPKVRRTIEAHRDLASCFGVEVIEFPRPGKA
jgi:hypothetical protein